MKREEEEKEQSERELERGFFEKRTRVTMESRCHETLVMDRVLISHARIDDGTGQGFRFPSLLFLFCFHDTFIYIQTLGISSTCPRSAGREVGGGSATIVRLGFLRATSSRWEGGRWRQRWLVAAKRQPLCFSTRGAREFRNNIWFEGGGFSCEVPLRPSIVPLLPTRASHCSLVSLTVRKFFLKILLSYVWRLSFISLLEVCQRRGNEERSRVEFLRNSEEEEINRGGSSWDSLLCAVTSNIESISSSRFLEK